MEINVKLENRRYCCFFLSSDKTSLLNCLQVLPSQYHMSLLIPAILGQVCCLKSSAYHQQLSSMMLSTRVPRSISGGNAAVVKLTAGKPNPEPHREVFFQPVIISDIAFLFYPNSVLSSNSTLAYVLSLIAR